MTKSYTCNICSNTFTQKHSLTTHLKENRCKASDLFNINNVIQQQKIEFKNLQKLHQENIQKIEELSQLKDKDLSNTNELSKLKQKYHENISKLKEKHNKHIQELTVELGYQREVAQILDINVQEEPVTEQQLTFDGIFSGRENEIRITSDKMISVFDFIKVVGGQRDQYSTWNRLLNEHKIEIQAFCQDYQFEKGKKKTPVVNVQGMVKLLFWLPGELAKQFRAKSAETMIRYLGGDLTLIELFKEKQLEENNQVIQILPVTEQQLTFDGIFSGREKDIRITPDKQISVYDFITVVGGQRNFYSSWQRILKDNGNEILAFCEDYKFEKGKKKTPVINVQGMVKLLFWLPGELAKQFRAKSAETMIRYLGGDLTLIEEIKAIDRSHIENPDNIAQIFREEVNGNLLFNQDQINTSKRLVNYYGDKKDIFYMFSFKYVEEWYAKYGIVGELREFHQRVQEHITEFTDICFHNIIQCSNIYKVEADFKESALVQMNKVKIPKKNGGNHVEIIKLSEIVTADIIKEEMIKIAGDRMLDPPPRYSTIEHNSSHDMLDIEREKTKQREIEYKEKEIELEIKKLEFEMMKFKYEKNCN
jgi:hypothetical protein